MSNVETDTVELRPIWESIRRYFGVVIALAVVGALVGVGARALTAATYVSEATLNIGPSYVTTGEGIVTAPVNTATERQVALSSVVIEPLLPTSNGSSTVSEFRASAEVATPPDSTTLILAVEASDPEAAADDALAWANGYLEYRETQSSRAVDSSVERLDAAIDEARADLEAATARVDDAAEDSGELDNALAAQRLAQDQIASLLDRRTALETATGLQGQLLGSPQVPTSPEGFGAGTWAIVGAILGAIIGMLIALGLASRRSTP